MKIRELKELERPELMNLFISLVSGHGKEVEIAHILAVHAAMRLPNASAIKHGVAELDTDELINLVESGVLNSDDSGYREEETAWNLILDSLEPEKVMDIIDNIDDYMKRYNETMKPVDDLKRCFLKRFAEREDDNNRSLRSAYVSL